MNGLKHGHGLKKKKHISIILLKNECINLSYKKDRENVQCCGSPGQELKTIPKQF